MPDSFEELERQVDRGNLFAHSALTEHAARLNEASALVNGLAGLLVHRGLVDADELMAVIEQVRTQTEQAGDSARLGVVVRKHGTGSEHDGGPVDCAARIPVCKAVCCRLRWALTVEEIETGLVKWDLGRPYFNRVDSDGYCQQLDRETLGCGVYEQRPEPCRGYSCEHDERIWTDFEGMVLNQEWIDEHLAANAMSPVEVFMSAANSEHEAGEPPA